MKDAKYCVTFDLRDRALATIRLVYRYVCAMSAAEAQHLGLRDAYVAGAVGLVDEVDEGGGWHTLGGSEYLVPIGAERIED